MQAFLIAARFLTTLPFPQPSSYEPALIGRSAIHYPLVGLILGSLLGLAALLLASSPVLLQAALLLSLWVLLTGALHLDGLADSADAWLGGLGSRERTLAIMQDPRSGPTAVVTLLLVLLVQFSAITALLERGQFQALLIATVLGRASLLALFLTTPYARPGGLGAAIAQHLPRRQASTALGIALAAVILLGGAQGVVACIVAAGLLWLIRRGLMQRLGGTTGDTAGALLVLTECAVLVVCAI
ncbi:adenosylcobinamide-GDP ribazoletransferase [Stutzerimonas tarimensis]|uniref:Adenosylcobinamide-GDP ribazoletransferase n=1 Tax=Stutzerimonas tarimensis TaxID=1507735 RepID=A0ABV7T849_9GAMM